MRIQNPKPRTWLRSALPSSNEPRCISPANLPSRGVALATGPASGRQRWTRRARLRGDPFRPSGRLSGREARILALGNAWVVQLARGALRVRRRWDSGGLAEAERRTLTPLLRRAEPAQVNPSRFRPAEMAAQRPPAAVRTRAPRQEKGPRTPIRRAPRPVTADPSSRRARSPRELRLKMPKADHHEKSGNRRAGPIAGDGLTPTLI